MCIALYLYYLSQILIIHSLWLSINRKNGQVHEDFFAGERLMALMLLWSDKIPTPRAMTGLWPEVYVVLCAHLLFEERPSIFNFRIILLIFSKIRIKLSYFCDVLQIQFP